jgi:hypothetical protein
MNGVLHEQIAPEILQAIVAQAAARGLSINDYLLYTGCDWME